MPDIKFNCPECGSKLGIDAKAAGYMVDCPICGRPIQIPLESQTPPPRTVLPKDVATSATTQRIPEPTLGPPPPEPDELLRLKERVHYLEKEKTELKSNLDAAELRNQNLARLEMKTADLLQQLEELAMQHAAEQQAAQQIATDRQALKEHIDSQAAETEQSRKQIAELTARSEALLKDNERLQAALKNSESEQSGMKERAAALEKQGGEAQALHAHMESLAAEFAQARKDKGEALSRNEQLAAEIERLKADLALAEGTRVNLESKLKAASKPKAPAGPAAQPPSGVIDERIVTLTQEKQGLEIRVDELSREKDSLAESLQKVQRNGQETEELKATVQELEKKVADYQIQMKEKESRITKYIQQSQKLTGENQALTTELISLRQKFIARDTETTAGARPTPAAPTPPAPDRTAEIQKAAEMRKELEGLRIKWAEAENRAKLHADELQHLRTLLEERAKPADAATAEAGTSMYRKTAPAGWLARIKRWTSLAGWLCLALGLLGMFLSLKSVYAYAPLFLLALILAVVSMAPRKLLIGYTLLPAILIAPLLLGFFLARHRNPDALAFYRQKISDTLSPANAPAPGTTPATAPAPSPSPPGPGLLPGAGQEIKPGASVVVDGVRVTFDRARIDKIDRVDPVGTRKQSDKPYLIVECSLENTSPGQSVFLHGAWEQTRLTDNLQNILRPAFPSRFAVDQVVGTITASELKPGQVLQDMIIFESPPDDAQSFQLVSDPGFWRKTQDEGYAAISRNTFTLAFNRDDLTRITEPEAESK